MRSSRLFVLALVALVSFTGCSKKKDSATGPADPTRAQQLVLQANSALGAIISAQISGPDPDRPSDLDFRTPYGLYQQALSADPGNLDARFGVAILGLATLTTDAQVNAAFDEWADYLDSHVPFEVPATPGPFGIPARLGRGRDVMKLPFEGVALSSVAVARAGLTGADPQLSTIQNILETRALPLLGQARSHLAVIAGNPSYTFIVTPEMQGDAGADPIEIDRTDILALRAGAGLLTAMCDVAVAYHLSFATYDSVGLVAAVSQGSQWLALRPNGSSRMAEARSALLEAADDSEASLHSLLAEVDDQDDDAIKADPSDLTPAAVESLEVYLGHVRTALGGGFRLTEDWDDDDGTPDVALVIRPATLFNSPVPDWKDLLPDYTAGVERRSGGDLYHSSYGQSSVSVNIPATAYYSAYAYTYTYDHGANLTQGGFGDAPLQAQAASLSHQLYKAVAADPDWSGDYSNAVNHYGMLSAGVQNVTFSWYLSYTTAATLFYVPTLTWDAATFAAWTWPDPSFHGLLPEIDTTSELLTLFGFDENYWERTIVLDWTGSGSGPVPPSSP